MARWTCLLSSVPRPPSRMPLSWCHVSTPGTQCGTAYSVPFVLPLYPRHTGQGVEATFPPGSAHEVRHVVLACKAGLHACAMPDVLHLTLSQHVYHTGFVEATCGSPAQHRIPLGLLPEAQVAGVVPDEGVRWHSCCFCRCAYCNCRRYCYYHCCNCWRLLLALLCYQKWHNS